VTESLFGPPLSAASKFGLNSRGCHLTNLKNQVPSPAVHGEHPLCLAGYQWLANAEEPRSTRGCDICSPKLLFFVFWVCLGWNPENYHLTDLAKPKTSSPAVHDAHPFSLAARMRKNPARLWGGTFPMPEYFFLSSGFAWVRTRWSPSNQPQKSNIRSRSARCTSAVVKR
jgi:hypothetical protein